MSDDLLPYYNRELSFVRNMMLRFAERNPRVAERLRVGSDGASKDPHIERLIEGFAYLTARVRRKLDDDFPELTDALLNVLYPHYLAPVPSMAIAQLRLDRGQGDLAVGFPVPVHAPMETEQVENEPCRFRTAYPVTAYPIDITAASLRGLPFSLPSAERPAKATNVLRIELKCFSAEMTFAKLALPMLRFHIAGQEQHVFALYELIMNNTLQVNIANTGTDPKPLVLGRDCIRQVGFDRDEGMLPLPGRSFAGYRLLSEYFAFPRKFLFFDIVGLSPQALAGKGNRVELTFFLDRTLSDLELVVAADSFRLACTPIVNLFKKDRDSETIRLTQTTSQVRLIPDARAASGHEVYSVDRVVATSPDGEKSTFLPFYAPQHMRADTEQRCYWYAARRPSTGAGTETDHGTEIDLSLVDLNFDPSPAPGYTLDVATTCTSRDLPSKLPFGGGHPYIRLLDSGAVAAECITPPTPSLRPPLGKGAAWRLVSHLNLNHVSLTTGPLSSKTAPDHDALIALREILKLYDFADSSGTRNKIEGIVSISFRRIVARTGGVAAGGFCRGIEVSLLLDESKFTDRGGYLFASILERFLGLYCSINSFIQLVVTSKQRDGEWCRWAPRAGEVQLL